MVTSVGERGSALPGTALPRARLAGAGNRLGRQRPGDHRDDVARGLPPPALVPRPHAHARPLQPQRLPQLERARSVTETSPELQLAVTRDDALLLWRGTGRGIRAARAGARGGFGEVVQLGTGRPGAVALRPDGAAVAAWLHDSRVYAAIAPAGGRFQRVEPVSGRDRPEELDASVAASGRPIVTWTTGHTRLSTSRAAP